MKILQLTSSLAIGGVTSVVSNLSHELKKFHEITIGCYKPYTNQVSIDTTGMKVVTYNAIHDFYIDVKHQQYDVIHFHVMLKTGILACVAHNASPRSVLVSHSHWSQYNKSGLVFNVYECISRYLIHRYIQIKIGCSDLAGKYLYPKDSFYTINNAINPIKFEFDPTNRAIIRESFGLTNAYVVGYVGQFNTVKNIPFLIESIRKARINNPNIVLMLVGGPMNDSVESLLKNNSWIVTAGLVNDAFRYYSAFDLFCLSSLWEGMPMVAIEAQANGLHCLLTDTITRLLNVNDHVTYLPLDSDQWADRIVDCSNHSETIRCDLISGSTFDIVVFSKHIEKLYFKGMNGDDVRCKDFD